MFPADAVGRALPPQPAHYSLSMSQWEGLDMTSKREDIQILY